MGIGGALGGPITALQYDWNMLPIGQQLWMKELSPTSTYPPLQAPETYNLDQDPGPDEERAHARLAA